MKTQSQLLAEIETFITRTGKPVTMFGVEAVGNGKLVGRMRDGGDITLRVACQIEAYLRAHRLRRV